MYLQGHLWTLRSHSIPSYLLPFILKIILINANQIQKITTATITPWKTSDLRTSLPLFQPQILPEFTLRRLTLTFIFRGGGDAQGAGMAEAVARGNRWCLALLRLPCLANAPVRNLAARTSLVRLNRHVSHSFLQIFVAIYSLWQIWIRLSISSRNNVISFSLWFCMNGIKVDMRELGHGMIRKEVYWLTQQRRRWSAPAQTTTYNSAQL